jgi:hypothetical protein
MVIPAPIEVDEIMRQVPKGKLLTINEVRALLASKHSVTIACPITTGIFAWIAAHAADESSAEGTLRTTPYWRTLRAGGELNPKYPGGISGLREKLEAEGHKVVQKGKRYFVGDFEKSLCNLRQVQFANGDNKMLLRPRASRSGRPESRARS